MKTVSLLFLLSIGSYVLHSQDVHNSNIKKAFQQYKSLYLTADKTALLEYTHPSIIQISGGEEYVIEDMTIDYNMYISSGLVITDLVLKQGSKVIQVGDDLQAMYPYERHLKKAKKELVENGFFLVVSTDDGGSWSFTDMKKHDRESIKIFVPNYNERFNIYLNSSHK